MSCTEYNARSMHAAAFAQINERLDEPRNNMEPKPFTATVV